MPTENTMTAARAHFASTVFVESSLAADDQLCFENDLAVAWWIASKTDIHECGHV